ncbi:hypothetical protein PTKIN_Ptkin01aG0251900 [Pterospermum kingtungense]
MLETLNLSHNSLNGSIPSSFDDLLSLTVVNISYNQLEIHIPNIKAFHEAPFDALRNNKGLCGNATGLMPCVLAASNNGGHRKSTKIIILVVLPVLFGSLLLAGSFFILCRKIQSRNPKSGEEQPVDIFTLWGYNGRILYENIIEATEDFSSNYCIGSGGYGTVYKAVLPSGQRHFRRQCSLGFGLRGSCLRFWYKPDSSNLTTLAGTLGYIAPDVIDQRLPTPVAANEVAEDVVSTWKLAFACLNGKPQLRPTMQQVAQVLSLAANRFRCLVLSPP